MSVPGTTDRWRLVESALEAALRAPPHERAAVLDRHCSSDDDLRREVESLLSAHDAAGDFLENTAASFVAAHSITSDEARSPSESPGAIVGRYRLLEEIGRGGMGTVWLAERADGQFEQRVALKLVRRGMDSDEILERFARERQILARLEHPNIARLLDGGLSDDGRPYFVMEYVPGAPITAHCDAHNATIEERLQLFLAVCRAVEYAHRNLVIHRDLKPSNVQVTPDGSVKLLDFGIARVISDVEPSARTRASAQIFTPEYASPEQFNDAAVTTASDVYQLGNILYELCTGIRPHLHAGSTRTDIRSAVLEATPTRPSAITQSVRAQRRLRGDLDTIVLIALRKEPERRYPSAGALADDIALHLANEPIRYGSDTISYRFVKFVQRHRLRVATIATLVLIAIGSASFYTLRMRVERDRARMEAAKSAQNAALLREFFESWDPDAADRGAVTSASVARDAVRRVESQFRNQPELLAASLSVLGDLFITLSQPATADTLLTRALAIQEQLHSEPNIESAATLARRGRLQALRGENEASIQSFRRAHALYQTLLGRDRTETLRAQLDLAEAYTVSMDYTESESLLRDALRTVSARGQKDSPIGLEAASRLGYTLFLKARYTEAIPLLRATLERERVLFGDMYVPSLYTTRSLASALRDNGELEEAEVLNREVLRVTRVLYGELHQNTVFATSVLSMLLERKMEWAEAEELARISIQNGIRVLGAHHPYVAIERTRLGGILLERAARGQAEAELRAGLRAMRRLLRADYADFGDVFNRLAYILVTRSAPDADRMYQEAVTFDRSRPPGSAIFVTDGIHYLAAAQHMKGDLAAAETNYRRALDLYRKQLPGTHPYRLAAEAGLSAVTARLR